MINEWGPALLVCFTVLVGMLYNNSRLTDLRVSLNARMDDLSKSLNGRMDEQSKSLNARMDEQSKSSNARTDDLSKSLIGRIEDLRDVLRAEASKNQSELLGKFAELDHRIEKLEAPRIE